MPAYFSVEIYFKKDILYPNLVNDVYSIFFESGFKFKSGFWFGEEMTLDEIIKWNQNHLQDKFKLGFTQHVKHDYKQILLESNNYQETRLFWMYANDRINLNLIIPEYDILQYDDKILFREDKINPIIAIAKELWSTEIVSTIQACIEFDGGAVDIEDLENGELPIIHPFCILESHFFDKMKASLKKEFEYHRLNNGVLMLNRSLIKVF